MRSTWRTVAVGGNVVESCDKRACTICKVRMILVRQSKKRLISAEPRAVIERMRVMPGMPFIASSIGRVTETRSEEHTSELQSRVDLVCRLLLEKKKKQQGKRHGR